MNRKFPLLFAVLLAALIPTGVSAQKLPANTNRSSGTTLRSFIAGGSANLIQSNSKASFIGGGQSNIVVTNTTNAVIGGGFLNVVSNNFATVGGGISNTASATCATVAGGQANTAAGPNSFIGAGRSNDVAYFSTGSAIGGGIRNEIRAAGLSIFSGGLLTNQQEFPAAATIGGGHANFIDDFSTGSAIGGGVSNSVTAVYFRDVSLGGGSGSSYVPAAATIGGGLGNTAGGRTATVGGGQANTNSGYAGFIGGGQENTIDPSASNAVVTGGLRNTARGSYSSAGGGVSNNVSGYTATVGGGEGNTADYDRATVGGGLSNTATGFGATVPGGTRNAASGTTSLAAGSDAKATNHNSFVWGGKNDLVTASTNDFSWTVRAPGGVRFITTLVNSAMVTSGAYNTNNNTSGLTNGVYLAPNSGAWASLSDSNAKTKVTAIKPREILSKLAAMSVTEWEYKADPNRRYIGPMAQDFHATFGLGSDDKSITTLDSDGVMYAAIQGLVEELKDRDKAMAECDAKIDALQSELHALREQIQSTLPPAR